MYIYLFLVFVSLDRSQNFCYTFLDNLVNIHEIKHWMDPSLIGFGWGLYQEKDEAIAIDVDIDTGGKM